MPSRRRAALVGHIAEALGTLGKLPVHRALIDADHTGRAFQSAQDNSAHQVSNVWGRFAIDPAALPDSEVPAGPVLLVDDEVDSRWTMTVAAWQLTGAGAAAVLPFALRAR